MAADPDSLDLDLAAATHQDLVTIVDEEKEKRKEIFDRGVFESEREAFELLPDDERMCDHCKTTCFLSAVTCPCSPDKLVCINHADKLCSCPPAKNCLRYRYTLDELPMMLYRLKVRAESYDNWITAVKSALEAPQDTKLELQDLRQLISEAEDKKFPNSELLQDMIKAVSEAEKCANVANQLVSRKVRTRNRQSLDVKYSAKLTLDELNCFYEQMITLPCIIPEAKLIKELIDKVVEFQEDSKDALEAETPDSEILAQLIEFGISLDVDLPEIPKLKEVLLQAKWLDEVRNTLSDPDTVTLDVMRKLMESGVTLAPHPACEKAMAELQELLTVSERWEEKARICLQARPRHVIATLEGIINEAKSITAYLPNVCALKDALKKAKEWTSKVETVQNADSYPYLDILETIVNKGRPIPVRLDQLPQVESQVAAAKSWRERTARTFLKKNSTPSLLQVLSPRNDIGIYGSAKKRKKMKEGEREKKEETTTPPATEVKPEQGRDPASIVASFKLAEQREVDCMKALRFRNAEKQLRNDPEVKYCICRRPSSGFMLQCELCKDWFHGTCVPLPKSANLKNKSQSSMVQAAKEMKFLCSSCLRSRRPRLETILSLLVSLQKLPVRLPEGEALQCLTERAMAWQDRARQALTTAELASALAKLSVLSQKMVEQAAREKTEKIINAELMKAANNPDLQGNLPNVAQNAFNGTTPPTRESNLDMETNQSFEMSPPLPIDQISQNSDDVNLDVEQPGGTGGGMSSEHAYSFASKSGTGAAVSPKKHQRKTPLVPRQLETPVLELSGAAKSQLEELMMEGDLLEVTLDETQHIWRILQACQPKPDDKSLNFERDPSALDFLKDNDENKEKLFQGKIKLKKEKEKKKRKSFGEDGQLLFKFKKPKEERKEIIEYGEDGEKIIKIKKKKIKLKDKNDKDKKIKHKEGEKGDKMKKKKFKMKKDGTKMGERKVRKEKKVKPKMGGDERGEDNIGDEDCSADLCLRPLGEEVNWVQCDKCNLWFHLLCVGLKDQQLPEDEDYICCKCRYSDKLEIKEETSLSEFADLASSLSHTIVPRIPSTVPLEIKRTASNIPLEIKSERVECEETVSVTVPGETCNINVTADSFISDDDDDDDDFENSGMLIINREDGEKTIKVNNYEDVEIVSEEKPTKSCETSVNTDSVDTHDSPMKDEDEDEEILLRNDVDVSNLSEDSCDGSIHSKGELTIDDSDDVQQAESGAVVECCDEEDDDESSEVLGLQIVS